MLCQLLVIVVAVAVVFTLNRSSYPTTSAVHPVSVLIHTISIIDTNYMVTDCETEKTKTYSRINQGRQIKCQRTGYESTTNKCTTIKKACSDVDTSNTFSIPHQKTNKPTRPHLNTTHVYS